MISTRVTSPPYSRSRGRSRGTARSEGKAYSKPWAWVWTIVATVGTGVGTSAALSGEGVAWGWAVGAGVVAAGFVGNGFGYFALGRDAEVSREESDSGAPPIVDDTGRGG